jgi:serine/threonine-protein kinase
MGQKEKAREAFERAVADLEERVQKNPGKPDLRAELGRAYAGLGRKREAIREAIAAADMVPLSRDAVDAPGFMQDLAQVYAWVGEPDKALDLLDRLLGMPFDMTAAGVAIDPGWDPVRDHPRYRAILDKHR